MPNIYTSVRGFHLLNISSLLQYISPMHFTSLIYNFPIDLLRTKNWFIQLLITHNWLMLSNWQHLHQSLRVLTLCLSFIRFLTWLFCVTESPPPPYSRLSPNEEHKPLGKWKTHKWTLQHLKYSFIFVLSYWSSSEFCYEYLVISFCFQIFIFSCN